MSTPISERVVYERNAERHEPSMLYAQVLSIELDKYQEALPQWADALSTHVGRIPPSAKDEEAIQCLPGSLGRFSGRIEAGMLGDMVLAKLGATPHQFSRSLRTPEPTLPLQVLLLVQVSGGGCLVQHDRTCTLNPGDWCLIDTVDQFDSSSLGDPSEYQILVLERPSDPDMLALIDQGVARRFDSKAGMSRVLRSTVDEAFKQMNRLGGRSGRCLQTILTTMTWDALREQLDAPPALGPHDIQCARIKRHIESHLTDPDLSVESIAQACSISVRSVHRAFAADTAGSVWKYVWRRRLSHCAAELRDPGQSHRSITDICFDWGFNSSSHFSRIFKEQFGVPPSRYRPATSPELANAHDDAREPSRHSHMQQLPRH